MSLKSYLLAFACLVSSALFVPKSIFAQPAGLSAEEVRRIVREELSVRQKELDTREKKVAEREAALDQKAALIDAKIAQLNNKNVVPVAADPKAIIAPGPFALEVSGYADMQADFYDYNEGIQQSEGSRGQSKSTFDTERFTMELEGKHEPTAIEFEAEVEFEHGGTGSAVELEYDEFGEFENETEKGGEVQLEEFFLQREFGDGLSAKVGRFYIGMGTLSRWYKPTDYLGVRRAEVEEVMLPGQWDEMGVSVRQEVNFGALTLQLVNGLDSTGFGSSRWIGGGHQSRFESIRAEDLAIVGRVDVNSLYPGLLLGASVYAGNTSGNRPRDDLSVDGTLVIGSFDYRYWSKVLKTQGAVFLGHLDGAQEISDRNSRLPNTLGVERTPVADGALGVWTEWGVNISPWIGVADRHEWTPFFRFDYYDTYFDRRDSLIDNPRFERSVYTAGLAYTYDDFLTLKLNWSRRSFGLSEINDQDILGIGIGFVY